MGRLIVRDHGRGLTEEEIARVGAFRQFDRKKHEQQGLGLGLVLVQKLAAQYQARFFNKQPAREGDPGGNRLSPSCGRQDGVDYRVAMKRITVLLAEDHTIVREGLRLLVEADGDIKIVGEATTGREAVQMTADLRPEVIVMDIAMPHLRNGLEATRQILKAYPQTRILILSAHSDPEYIEQMVKVGASGFLVKQSSGKVLAKAIRELHRGKSYFTPSIAQFLKKHHQDTQSKAALCGKHPAQLTSREAEMLQLIAEGEGSKQIAVELGISIKTVEKHRQSLMEKIEHPRYRGPHAIRHRHGHH